MQKQDKIAVLIDGENISRKYIKLILDEVIEFGTPTYKRVYADFSEGSASAWKDELRKYALTPIFQINYTKNKNASDSAMIIDAMDILYTGNVTGFCLVTSDSDFTKLASRLRESGKMVIGMGEDKTPLPFRKACDIFTVLEVLLEDNTIEKEESEGKFYHPHVFGRGQKKISGASLSSSKGRSSKEKIEKVSKEKIEEIVVKIITENQNNDRETGLGEVGSRLVKVYPDFDVRRYGYSLLSKFLETLPKLKLIQEGTKVSVTLYEDKSKKDMLEEYIIRQIQMTGDQGISLGTLGNRIRIQFGDFKVRDYGYSQFKQYIQSFPKVELIEDGERTRAVYVED